MSSIAWLNSVNSFHTCGIQILSDDPDTITEFKYSIITYCKKTDCKYFVQGESIRESGRASWLFIEFFGERNHNKILSVIDSFEKSWGNKLHNNSVLWDEPAQAILRMLNLTKI